MRKKTFVWRKLKKSKIKEEKGSKFKKIFGRKIPSKPRAKTARPFNKPVEGKVVRVVHNEVTKDNSKDNSNVNKNIDFSKSIQPLSQFFEPDFEPDFGIEKPHFGIAKPYWDDEEDPEEEARAFGELVPLPEPEEFGPIQEEMREKLEKILNEDVKDAEYWDIDPLSEARSFDEENEEYEEYEEKPLVDEEKIKQRMLLEEKSKIKKLSKKVKSAESLEEKSKIKKPSKKVKSAESLDKESKIKKPSKKVKSAESLEKESKVKSIKPKKVKLTRKNKNEKSKGEKSKNVKS